HARTWLRFYLFGNTLATPEPRPARFDRTVTTAQLESLAPPCRPLEPSGFRPADGRLERGPSTWRARPHRERRTSPCLDQVNPPHTRRSNVDERLGRRRRAPTIACRCVPAASLGDPARRRANSRRAAPSPVSPTSANRAYQDPT